MRIKIGSQKKQKEPQPEMRRTMGVKIKSVVRNPLPVGEYLPLEVIQRLNKVLELLLSPERSSPPPKAILNHYKFDEICKPLSSIESLIEIMEEYSQKYFYYLPADLGNPLMQQLAHYGQFEQCQKIYTYLCDWKLDDYHTYSIMTDAAGKNGHMELAEETFNKAVKVNKCNIFTYTSLINVAGKNGNLKLAEEMFRNAVKLGIANERTYATMIAAAGDNNAPALANKIFEEAIRAKKANEYVFSNMIAAAGDNGLLSLALEIFERAVREKKVNQYLYLNMLRAAGNNGNLELARNIFKQAEQEEFLVSELLYISLIDMASKNGGLTLAKEVFNRAQALFKANATTYISMIDAAGNNGALWLSIEVFEQALMIGKCNEMTYISLIIAAGKNNALSLAQKTFERSVKDSKTIGATYAALIDVAGEHGALEIAQQTFQRAINDGKANKSVYSSMLRAAVRNGSLLQAQDIFHRSISSLKLDEAIYANLIGAACKQGALGLAQQIFTQAEYNKKLSPACYVNLIDAAGKHDSKDALSIAHDTFKKAVRDKKDNAATYTSMMIAAAKQGNFALSLEIFRKAQAAQKANEWTYASFIDIAGKNQQFKLAETIFKDAIKNQKANEVTFATFIDVQAKQRKLDIAEKTFNQAETAQKANEWVYTSFIQAAGKLGNLPLAYKKFQQAVEQKKANQRTYACMIDAAGRNNDLDLARKIFHQAVTDHQANEVTYTCLITAAGICNNPEVVEEAFRLAKEAGYANPRTFTTVVTSLKRCKGDHRERIAEIFDEAFLADQWNDESLQYLHKAVKELGETSFAPDTIVRTAIPNAWLVNKKPLSKGAFGQIFSATWYRNGDKTQSYPVALKEIHVQSPSVTLSEVKALPESKSSSEWARLYHEGMSPYLCVYDQSKQDWYLCTLELNTVSCQSSIALKELLEKLFPKNLIGHQISEEVYYTIFHSDFEAVTTSFLLKHSLHKLCELALMHRKKQEWQALRNEVMLLMKLSHPHVIRYHAITLSEQPYGMLMELYKGGDLDKTLYAESKDAPRPTENQRDLWIYQMALGLEYLHAKGIVHGDLKPPNMLLDDNGQLVLGDFGLSSTEKPGQVRGTCSYMAPELLLNQSSNTKASDVYSLGVVLWELLEGKRPWQDKTPEQIINIVGHQNQSLLIRGSWPPEYKELIRAMLAKNPDQRPTMSDCVAKLKLILESRGVDTVIKISEKPIELSEPDSRSKPESKDGSDLILMGSIECAKLAMEEETVLSQKRSLCASLLSPSSPFASAAIKSSVIHDEKKDESKNQKNSSGIDTAKASFFQSKADSTANSKDPKEIKAVALSAQSSQFTSAV